MPTTNSRVLALLFGPIYLVLQASAFSAGTGVPWAIALALTLAAAVVLMFVFTLLAARLLDVEVPLSPGELVCFDDYCGEYGVPTAAGQDAIRLAARLEGLVLDPVYTGKSMSGLLDLARRGVLDPEVPTVFLHTGGLAIVFAFETTVRAQAVCTKIRR